jgi:hypothetical protein
MPHEKDDPRRVSRAAQRDSLAAAHRHLGGGTETVFGIPGEPHSERSTREGRTLWRWAKEAGCCLEPAPWLARFEKDDEGGQEHRVWYSAEDGRYYKATHAGRFGWYAFVDSRYDKRTQEDELFIGMGGATPLQYLDRLLLQNEFFSDDIRLEGMWIEAEGLAILTSQTFIAGSPVIPAEILEAMQMLGFERIPGLPANSEDCFSFYHRAARIGAFDAHTLNFVRERPSAFIVPIDLVMVRADDAFHDYTCRRIDAADSPAKKL